MVTGLPYLLTIGTLVESLGIRLLLWIYVLVESDAVGHGIREIQDYTHTAKIKLIKDDLS